MGICVGGRSLRQIVEERDSLHRESGCAYGMASLDLMEEDPVEFMRFQRKLVAGCIRAREIAKLISANPMSLIQGELLFLLANPEGDVVSASYGLAGHIQCMPFIIKTIAELGFEEDPGINPGDIFSVNDAMYGPPHNADCYTFLPVFYQDELVGWTVGLNHITDVGGIQPGGLGTVSTSVFTDGFTYPPTKTGANFKQHRWWDLHWKRRTRTELFNVLDDKMRAAGIVVLHDIVREIIDEFGIEYFRRGLREIIERERRLLVNRIKTMAVPGVYHFLQFKSVHYKDTLGRLWPASNRNWVLHKPAELHIRPNGTLYTDLEGLSSEGDFHCNCYEPGVRMLTSLGLWPMFAHTETLNTALLYMTEWNLPPGCMFNPQNPWAATVMGLGEVGGYIFIFQNCLSYAFFSRGFIEETFPQDGVGVGYGLMGVLGDGFPWAGGDMALITCSSEGATPYRDGFPASVCTPNPASDAGEVELSEFLQPTQLNIGRKLIPDLCGHGKYRGGLAIGTLQLVNQPGQSLLIAAFGATSGTGGMGLGMSGGYPRANDVVIFAHNTNARELFGRGEHLPRDFVEMMTWIRESKLKASEVEVYTGSTPSVLCSDGDLFACSSGCRTGWGDPLERPLHLVEEDIRYGWITVECARTVYGAVSDGEGKLDRVESERLRSEMRARRQQRSVDAKDWWHQERKIVLDKKWKEDIYNMYADNLRWDKFRNEFFGMWQLAADYSL